MAERASGEFPEHPLLDMSELDEVWDLRAEVSHLLPYLKPYEAVVKIEPVSKVSVHTHPSALAAIMRLCGVERVGEIGEKGPSVASLPFAENAGLPELTKFENVFGRDSLVVAMLLKDLYPNLLRSTVIRLAELQGTTYDMNSGEEPGGIVHDNLDPSSPVAQKFSRLLGWKYPFYATVDATPHFINTVCLYAEGVDDTFLSRSYKDKNGDEHTMHEALDASVGWLTRRLAQNPEGLLEYHRTAAKGMDNQAWKDSFHAYVHANGNFANHNKGIASVEVQGYAYDALVRSADVYERLGDQRRASSLRDKAQNLRRKVLDNFWIENDKGGFFALGTDRDDNGNLRPLAVRASNMGHLLNSMILDGDEPELVRGREAIIRNLFSPDMLAAAGIRTLAAGEAAFNPYSYHNGGVWPWDNGWIAAGLERHGYFGLAWELNKRIFVCIDATKNFPEVVRGGSETRPEISKLWADVWDSKIGLLYPMERAPQEIQAWTVAAILAAKHKWPLADGLRRKVPAMPLAATTAAKRALEQELIRQLP